jgi:flagellar motor switch/type III secretory pathway protein FliN
MSRACARSWGALQRHFIASDSVATSLAQSLERFIGQPVRAEQRRLRALPGEIDGPLHRLRLRLPAGTGDITLGLDSRLVIRLVNFALNRDDSLYDPLQPVEPELLGAAAAVVAKIIEDSGLALDVSFSDERLDLPGAARLQLDATLCIGKAAYPIVLGFAVKWPSAAHQQGCAQLSSLGTIPLGLPLVVGESLVKREELAALVPGTAFLTGQGLWVDESLVGHAVLIAPQSDRGIRVNLQPGGKIVLGEKPVTLNHDDSNPTSSTDGEVRDLTDTLFEAPVVMRVELGSVSLPARQWAALRKGDIIETGQPVGTEVTLRVAGQAIAQGELLNVEGELGVRITKLLVGEER